jgi:hypothetical protein
LEISIENKTSMLAEVWDSWKRLWEVVRRGAV